MILNIMPDYEILVMIIFQQSDLVHRIDIPEQYIYRIPDIHNWIASSSFL